MKFNKNEKLSIYNGIASTVSTNAVNGYIPLFAIGVLGASNTQMGLITSLPSIIGMLALIPGAMWLNRVKSKKKFAVASTLSTRLLFMLILFVPFLSPQFAPWALVALIALLNFPGALSGLSWQSMIGDLVPEERRGGFFSSRNRWTTITAMIVTFSTGFFLEQFNENSVFPYQILFIAGFGFALMEVYYLMKHKEETAEHTALEVKEVVEKKKFSMDVFKHKPYVAFIICALLFNFGAQMGWSIFSIYQIREAHATALWFSMFSVTNQLSQIVSIKWWAKYADKYGNTMLLFVAAAGMATAPALMIVSTNLYYITFINLWIGIFVAGTNLLLFNQLLNSSPQKQLTTYIANYNFLLAIIGFLAPQFGVLLLNQFGMQSAMLSTSLVRMLGALAFLFVALKMLARQRAHSGDSHNPKNVELAP
ncbi:MFS transporter [Rossellomorea vietnamensis]|uniref:MFS transporter n=1 Tax=Rossellomorea vietnamensis TaxID=218284 RepID=A0A5D4K7R8_9BACI|nr:MFS transporter [Rossellomorea vietnamensis]TYR73328.1 MFS transporter [Rossellomorea vietnamensis]